MPANASDALYCMLLAQNGVHGAMAGYTGFSVGLVVRSLGTYYSIFISDDTKPEIESDYSLFIVI